MADCNHDCSHCGENCSERDMRVPQNAKSHIKKVIAVVSGKGGVGKSSITSMLACKAKQLGKKVAVLDADITGPSIPTAFGLKDRAFGLDGNIMPVETKGGIKAMSLNLLLEDPTQPVVWRGAMISNCVKQFWTDVAWGDIDYMFVDMPPGTGDVPLTVFQSLPVDGIVIATTPQELVGVIVNKAVKMAQMMHVPILAIVENMSYYECPKCHEKLYVFGKSNIEDVCSKNGILNYAQVPIDSKLASAMDEGKIEEYPIPFFDDIINQILI